MKPREIHIEDTGEELNIVSAIHKSDYPVSVYREVLEPDPRDELLREAKEMAEHYGFRHLKRVNNHAEYIDRVIDEADGGVARAFLSKLEGLGE